VGGPRQRDPNERMHDHPSHCTYKMGVAGDRCPPRGEETGMKSTVEGDQRDKREWKRWTALRQRHANRGIRASATAGGAARLSV